MHSRLCQRDCLPAQVEYGLIVVDAVIYDNAAVAVVGILAEAQVGNKVGLRKIFREALQGQLDDTIVLPGG